MSKKNTKSSDGYILAIAIYIVVTSVLVIGHKIKIQKLQDDYDLLELRIERDSIIHSHRLLDHLNDKL